MTRQVDARYTPNGTKVPDDPPPVEQDEKPLPPVPPFPDVMGHEGEPQPSSFVSGQNDLMELYDTCESKPKMRQGDVAWKPVAEKDGTLSASEAKQVWLEREVRSLKVALDRVAVPQSFQQSGYWNAGFDYGSSFQTYGFSCFGNHWTFSCESSLRSGTAWWKW